MRATDLDALCKQRGWSRSRLILEMRRAAGPSNITLPGDDSLKRMLRAWINGSRGLSDHHAGIFGLIFGAPFEVSEATVATAPASERPVADVEAWQLMDALTSSRLSAEAVGEMRRTALGYAAFYPHATPAQLLPLVQKQLRRVQVALEHPMPLSVHRDAVRLLGLLAGLAGNLALDLRDFPRAAGYFDAGRLAGQQTEDGDLTAWVLATSSLVPFFNGNPLGAVLVLEESLGAARTGSSQRRQAWIQALLARAAAQAGDAARSLASLDAAHRALDLAEAPQGTDFFDAPRLAGLVGTTMLLLSRINEAEPMLATALSRRAAGDLKGRALLTLDLASCRVVGGEIVAAADLVEQALNTAAGDGLVAPIVARAREVSTAMMAQDPAQAARVRDHLRAVTAGSRIKE